MVAEPCHVCGYQGQRTLDPGFFSIKDDNPIASRANENLMNIDNMRWSPEEERHG